MKKDMYSYFWEKYDDTPPRYEELFDVVPSDAAYEKFSSAIGLGRLLEKPEGEDLQSDAPLESYTIVCKNRSFGRLVRFSRETIDDSQKLPNILQDTVGSWGRMVPITKEDWYSDFFNKGAYSSGYDAVFDNTITGVIDDPSGDTIYDGKPFFASNHPDKVGNTYANKTDTATLTAANLRTYYETMTQTNNRDERAEVVIIQPDILLIPPALRFTAQEILNTTLIPFSQDNTTNVLASIVEPFVWPYIDGSDDWILGRKKMGLMATDRLGVELDIWVDETSKDIFSSIYTRWGGCVTSSPRSCAVA